MKAEQQSAESQLGLRVLMLGQKDSPVRSDQAFCFKRSQALYQEFLSLQNNVINIDGTRFSYA